LFFDELDSIAKSRGGNAGDGGMYWLTCVTTAHFSANLLLNCICLCC